MRSPDFDLASFDLHELYANPSSFEGSSLIKYVPNVRRQSFVTKLEISLNGGT